MKKVYWRPRAISRPALLLITVVALGGMTLVEHWPANEQRSYFEEKLAASELAAKGMERIYDAKARQGILVDDDDDPTESGLIGVRTSPVSTLAGDLQAKQTTINPNFAAVVVDLLRRAGVKEGDAVAVGCSGSFPALNLAVYSALETLRVKPIVILSASSSQWGANQPELMWIDMERILRENDLISFRAVAASYGGLDDCGEGLSQEGKDLIEAAIRRNHVPLLKTDSFERSVQARVDLFKKYAGASVIRAYVNVGGGTVSVGRSVGKRAFQPGLNLHASAKMRQASGVMSRFIQERVPVIHLEEVRSLAEKYDLPIAPKELPEVGQGKLFIVRAYHKVAAGVVLALILAALYAFIHSDVGFRLLRNRSKHDGHGHPEPMV